jgi:serine/threonine protein kinase
VCSCSFAGMPSPSLVAPPSLLHITPPPSLLHITPPPPSLLHITPPSPIPAAHPPSQAVLARGYDRCFDVWTLGVLLYEMSLGFTPFASMATRQRQGSVEGESMGVGGRDSGAAGDDPVVALCKRIVKCKLKFPRSWQQVKQVKQVQQVQQVQQRQRAAGKAGAGAGAEAGAGAGAEAGAEAGARGAECADARALMGITRALLVSDPHHRLGCMRGGWAEVKSHRWFGGKTDFEAILLRQPTSTSTPPWAPAARDCDPEGPLPLFLPCIQ